MDLLQTLETQLKRARRPDQIVQIRSQIEAIKSESEKNNIELNQLDKYTHTANLAVPAEIAVTVKQADTVESAATANMTDTAVSAVTPTKNSEEPRTKRAVTPTTTVNGFTRISHRILETLYTSNLSPRQYRILLFIIRKSLGWGEEEVELSTREFIDALGLDSAAVWRTIPDLIKDGYLLKREGKNQKNVYSLNPKKFGRLIPPAKTAVTVNSTVTAVLAVEDTVNSTVSGNCQFDSMPPYINIEAKDNLNKSLSLEEIFESYFSEIRAPIAAKQEREAFLEIRERNPDLTDAEFLECFELISKDRDSKGNPISFKFVWMAKGLDKLLKRARGSIQDKTRKAMDRAQAVEEARLKTELEAQQASQETSMTQEEIANAISQRLGSFGKRIEAHMANNEMTQEEIQKRREFLKEQAKFLNSQDIKT